MGTRDRCHRGQPSHHHDKGKRSEPQQRSSAAVSSSSGSAAPSIQPQSTMTPTPTAPSHSTNTALDPHLSQLIQRQMVVSRALSEQEDVSLDMIQTLVRLNETVQQQEQELQQLKQQKPQQQQKEQEQQKEQSLLLDTVERQRFEIEKLEQYKEEVEMAHSLLQKELDESQAKSKHQAQHMQELQSQLEQCQAKLAEKDALIQSLSSSQAATTATTNNIPNPKPNRRETAPPTTNVSASTSLRQRKAAREERLKEIMNRLKGGHKTATPKVRAPTRQETTFATLNLQAASILRRTGPPRLVVSSSSSPSVSPLSQQDEEPTEMNPSFSKDSHETLDTYVSSDASQDDHLVEL